VGKGPHVRPLDIGGANVKQDEELNSKQPARRTWTRPQMKYIGDVGDVLQGGGGKFTVANADPGDIRKPTGQG